MTIGEQIQDRYLIITGRYLRDVVGFVQRVRAIVPVECDPDEEVNTAYKSMDAYLCRIFMPDLPNEDQEISVADLQNAFSEFRASKHALSVKFDALIKLLGPPIKLDQPITSGLPQMAFDTMSKDFSYLYRYADKSLAAYFTIKLSVYLYDSTRDKVSSKPELSETFQKLRYLNLAVEEAFGDGAQD
jgi:hypothetical protein